MTNRQHILLRAAARIRQRLLACRSQPRPIHLPDVPWEECSRLTRQIGKADAHGWLPSARCLRSQLSGALRILQGRLEEILRESEAHYCPLIPTQRQIYEELLAIHDEFDDVEIDLKQERISVQTDPIELEGVYLGPFSMELECRYLGESSPYAIAAIDPHPAAANSETTHPHVQGTQLCEGEGRIPIRRALGEGRLCDFFLIVRQTLNTYNAASAFVSLDQWEGIECHDCGSYVDEDERYSCERCETYLCRECAISCTECGNYLCNDCQSCCRGCDELACHDCLTTCADCGESYCSECKTHDKCADRKRCA